MNPDPLLLAPDDAARHMEMIGFDHQREAFGNADGAGMHCEALNRSMANRQILDWLDDTLRPVG